MQKAKIISAVILSCALLVLSSGCSKENDNIDFGEHTELTSVSENISEITQVTEDTDEITFGDPVIGGNAILSQDTLDDLTASLIIRDISCLPDGTEGGDYYGGRFIVAEVKDNKSGATVENILPEGAFIYGNPDLTADDKIMRISAECAADSIELFAIKDSGEKKYILKVEYIQGDDRRIAAFACCDMSRYEESGGYLKWYKIDTGYECKISQSFAYIGGNIFVDSLTELEYEFNTENLRVTVRDMDSSEIVFGDPEIGKNSILSQDTFNEYSAVVEAHNIFQMPEDNDSDYGKMYGAEKLFLKLFINDELIAYGGINSGLFGSGTSDWGKNFYLPEKCTGKGSTRIFQIEQTGKKHYVVMQYSIYDKESDTIGANFACFDSEVYEKYKDSPEEVIFPLIWYDLKFTKLDYDMFDSHDIPISDTFEYVGDGIFKDNVYGYEISFDCEKLSAEAHSIQ